MKKTKLKGIGGWLILPIIGLFSSIPFILYDLLSMNAEYVFNFYIGLLSFFDIAFLIFVSFALFSIFNKKKYVSKIMITFYIANISVGMVFSYLTEDFSSLFQAIIGGAIWIPYFLKSERVKNTFVK